MGVKKGFKMVISTHEIDDILNWAKVEAVRLTIYHRYIYIRRFRLNLWNKAHDVHTSITGDSNTAERALKDLIDEYRVCKEFESWNLSNDKKANKPPNSRDTVTRGFDGTQ